jgi:hypothetical protein
VPERGTERARATEGADCPWLTVPPLRGRSGVGYRLMGRSSGAGGMVARDAAERNGVSALRGDSGWRRHDG